MGGSHLWALFAGIWHVFGGGHGGFTWLGASVRVFGTVLWFVVGICGYGFGHGRAAGREKTGGGGASRASPRHGFRLAAPTSQSIFVGLFFGEQGTQNRPEQTVRTEPEHGVLVVSEYALQRRSNLFVSRKNASEPENESI